MLTQPHVVPTSRFATSCAYAYLLRVQLLVLLAMWGLPLLAFGPWDTPKSLLQNVFITTPYGLFLSTLTALLVGWSLLLTARLVLLNGEDRFGITQWWTTNTLKPAVVVGAVFVAAPIVATQLITWSDLHGVSEQTARWKLAAAVSGGAATAYLIAHIGLWISVRLAPVGTLEAAQSFPTFGVLRRWINNAGAKQPPAIITKPLRALFGFLPDDVVAGYIDRRKSFANPPFPGDNPGYLLPWSGHFVALTFGALTMIVYWTIGWYRTSHVGQTTVIPALVSIMLLLTIANWAVSLLTFFFDRFRIPLLIPALVLALGTSWCSEDHVFEIVQRTAAYESVPPKSVMASHTRTGPLVIVATAGGGIQSAAWTARVLTGLEEQFAGPPAFSARLALVSAVSGGAVGSMFFLNEYRAASTGGGFSPASSSAVVARAEAGALDEVAWSLVYNDVPRVFTGRSGSDPLLDRGRVLEEYWRKQGGINANMGDWRAGVVEGWRPAVIFNATIAETAEPLLIATTDFEDPALARVAAPGRKRDLPVRRSFREFYRGADIPVVTAARLAATFPYVSPAARAYRLDERSHVVDGGYYDNYGVSSAIDWVDSALRGYVQGEGPDVLFILIRSFPDDALDAGKDRGWFFQTWAPIQGLFNVRTTTQLVRDRFDLLQLRERIGKEKSGKDDFHWKVRFATFKFPEDGAPLSWRMSDRQIDAIEAKWKEIVKDYTNGNSGGDDLKQVQCAFMPRQNQLNDATCRRLLAQDPW